MKYGYLILLAICCFICGCSGSNNEPSLPAPPAGTAKLLVTTMPPSANITQLSLTMSLPGMAAIRSTFSINPTTRAGEVLLPGLCTGVWAVTINAWDSRGTTILPTTRSVALFAGKQTRITVRANTSEIHFAQHEPVQLVLQTYDGSGETTHPDVVHIPGGFGTEHWPYWMVATPYANDNSAVENPSLYVSNDGVNWTIPVGVTNPVVPLPPANSFNADPDMVYYQDQLWLYYKQNVMAPLEYRVNLTRSSDGVHWSKPVTVLKTYPSDPQGDTITSPAITVDGQIFSMWYVIHNSIVSRIFKRTSTDGYNWSTSVPTELSGLDGRVPWHLDVIRAHGRYEMLLDSAPPPEKSGAYLLQFGYSMDAGITWNFAPPFSDAIFDFERPYQYRGTLIPLDGDDYQLWYGARNGTKVWSTNYLKVRRINEQLYPLPGNE